MLPRTAIACLLAGCAAAPEELARSPVPCVVRYLPDAVRDAADASPCTAAVEVFAVRNPPTGTSLDAEVLAIAADHGAPFRGAVPLPSGCLFLAADAAAQWTRNERLAPPTATQAVGRTRAIVAPNLRSRVFFPTTNLPGLQFDLEDKHVVVGITIQTADGTGWQEVLLRSPMPREGVAGWFVPAASRGFAGHVLLVTTTAVTEPAALAAALAAGAVAERPPLLPAVARQLRIAGATYGANNRRSALLAVAQQAGAARCVDVLLCADEAALIAITERTRALGAGPDFAWRFEQAAWQALMPALERDELPAGMLACLLRHFGAVASMPAELELLLASSADAAALREALQQDNLAALDDRDAATRMRAHGWLLANGGAVEGFDPLASRDERRAALQRHAAAQSEAAARATPETGR